MNDVLKKGSELGVSKVTLEVPGISPDARHIYEKIGFKKNKRISDEDDVWGGLTSMTYKYKNGGKH
nr:MAG TPA: N-acetyltransferase-like protein [Caudoviricetes sp.]